MGNNIRLTNTKDGCQYHTLQVGDKVLVLGVVRDKSQIGHCLDPRFSRIITKEGVGG